MPGKRTDNPARHLPTAQRARRLRKSLDMTQTEFSQWLGVSVNTVRNWEQGKRGPSGPAAALLGLVEVIPDEIAKALKNSSSSAQANASSETERRN